MDDCGVRRRKSMADQANPRLPGFTAGIAASSGGMLIRRIGRNLVAGQRDKRHADIGLAAGAVDQAGAATTSAPSACDRRDGLADREPGGDDVLDDEDARAGGHLEAAQAELALLALDPDGGNAEMAGGLVAGNDAADRRRDDQVDLAEAGGDAPCRRAPRQSCSVRSGYMKTRAFWMKTGLRRPELRMK